MDTLLDLGYRAATDALTAQWDTLTKLRDRALGLLSASTIATSLAVGIGLVDSDAAAPTSPWAVLALLMPAILIAGNAVYALMPVPTWHGTVNPTSFVWAHDHGRTEDDALKEAIQAINTAVEQNDPDLRRRLTALRVAVGLLVIDLALILVLALP